ncbi:MAG: hypothetical protein C0483_07370 [Pirellula sp.]|nr:hypothetical protein [Pirellula sp.]
MIWSRMWKLVAASVGALALTTSAAFGAENPFAPAETTSSDTVTWTQQSENAWQLGEGSIRPVQGEIGKTAGIICGSKLIVFAMDGTPEVKVVPLAKEYAFVGLRAKYIVGVTKEPAAVEILDRTTGAELRRVALGEGEPWGMELHPTSPATYICLSRKRKITDDFSVKGFFAVVDETRAKVEQSDDYIGQKLTIDPTGRFLVSGFADVIPLGAQLVRVPGVMLPRGAVPGRPTMPQVPVPGRPGYYGGRYPGGGYVPNYPQRGPDQIQVVTRTASVSVAIVFDLEDELNPRPLGLFEFEGFSRGLRLSYDGHRLTGLTEGKAPTGRDPLNPKESAITFDTSRIGVGAPDTELRHHPSAPITAVAAGNKVDFLDTQTGKQLGETAIPLPPDAAVALLGMNFSPDGRQLLLAVTGDKGESLLRIRVPLSESNRKLIEERAIHPVVELASGKLTPLTEFDGLRGGLAASMRAAEIAKRYSDGVVIVRGGDGTGTGFVVGSSGYILTCAHCVSRLTPTTVVYRSAEDQGKEIEAPAEVLQRDAKRDLALLKIKTTKPLASLVLAPPIDVAHGEEVTVISNPALGDEVLKNTITTGVVSSPRQVLDDESYIQSSAAVNPGSSGGPMFDQHGEVIGMVVLKARIEGVGFAIPIRTITEFLLKSASYAGDDRRLLRSWVESKSETQHPGRFVSSDVKTLMILEPGATQSRILTVDTLSAGDRALLALIISAAAK